MSLVAGLVTPALAGRATAWVAGQRERHRPGAEPLDENVSRRLAGWFDAATLESVRVRSVPRLDAGPAVRALEWLGVRLPLEIDRVWGITFVDTIVVLDRVPVETRLPLLFHECVHVTQYRRLGARGFLEAYVRGWLENGRRYREIPLEVDAYALQRRFVEAPGDPVPVDAAVAERWGTP